MMTTAIFVPASETRMPIVAVSAYAGATDEMLSTVLPMSPTVSCRSPLSWRSSSRWCVGS